MFKSKPCTTCAEKDQRITDLKEQITYLRSVLHPAPIRFHHEPPQAYQEDMILDGGGKEETRLPEDEQETPEVLAERAAMLGGTY